MESEDGAKKKSESEITTDTPTTGLNLDNIVNLIEDRVQSPTVNLSCNHNGETDLQEDIDAQQTDCLKCLNKPTIMTEDCKNTLCTATVHAEVSEDLGLGVCQSKIGNYNMTHKSNIVDLNTEVSDQNLRNLIDMPRNPDVCIQSGLHLQGKCSEHKNELLENTVLIDSEHAGDLKNLIISERTRPSEITPFEGYSQDKIEALISIDKKLWSKHSGLPENIIEPSVDSLSGSADEQSSYSDNSFPSSPVIYNGVNQRIINFDELLLKEYENLKENYMNLQVEYKIVLEREKHLCTKMKENDGQDDELCDKLTNINGELREQLEKMTKDLNQSQTENISLQATVKDLSNARDVLSLESKTEGKVMTKLKKTIEELEIKCSKFAEESETAKEKLLAHDGAAKRAITALQKEMTLRVDQVSRMHDEVVREKDSQLVKMSKLETDVEQYKKNEGQSERKSSENRKEIERLKVNLKQKDIEYNKLQAPLDMKEKDLERSQTEVTNLKEEINSQAMKVKWAQNKLKQELETHKETKKQLAQVTAKLQEAKEEGEQIRINCQEMIKKYQSSEDMKSIQLDQQLKERETSIRLHEHEIIKQDEIYRLKLQELEALKAEHRKAMEEMMLVKSEKSVLDGKLSNYATRTADYEKQVTTLKKDHERGKQIEDQLEKANRTLKRYEDQTKYYTDLEDRLRTQVSDLETELKSAQQKVSELLLYTEKLAENNACWKSQATGLQSKVDSLLQEKDDLEARLQHCTTNSKKHVSDFEKEIGTRDHAVDGLSLQLEMKQKLVEQLTLSLEEEQDEVKVQKRKNVASLKDLQRQLQQAKKRIEKLETGQLNSQMTLTNKSRTSSTSSSNDSPPQYASDPALSNSVQNNNPQHQLNTEYSIVQPSRQTRNHSGGEIEIDKSILVDRICRLQKAHAKKNERIEFMEEHINTLVDDIQKKTRIIQFYVMREEAGTLAPNRSDHNKAQMSRKGGIMASVYSSRPSDKDMTLELSLQINRKLQAVVEDTILKNMTLKESLNTLGDEIARLQKDMKKARK